MNDGLVVDHPVKKMNDDVQVVVTFVLLLFLLALFLLPFLIFFVYVFFQNSKRKRIRENVQTTQQQLIAGGQSVAVRYASEPRFKAFLKIFPWEGAGLLATQSGNVIFLGEMLNGTPLNIRFPQGQATLRWLGKCPWPNGAVSWFEFDLGGEKHFFTSETGAFVFGSNKSTKAAYDLAQGAIG